MCGGAGGVGRLQYVGEVLCGVTAVACVCIAPVVVIPLDHCHTQPSWETPT